MDAEKRIRRIGHRIEQPPDELLALRPEPVVLAAKRHDRRLVRVAGESGDTIGLQAGADHEQVELERAARGFDPRRGTGDPDRRDLGAEENGASGRTDVAGERLGDRRGSR